SAARSDQAARRQHEQEFSNQGKGPHRGARGGVQRDQPRDVWGAQYNSYRRGVRTDRFPGKYAAPDPIGAAAGLVTPSGSEEEIAFWRAGLAAPCPSVFPPRG